MAQPTRGYSKGIVVTIGIGIIAALLVKWVGSVVLHPIAGTLLALIAFAASILYFGKGGLRLVPISFIGIGLWFGKRVPGKIYSEGWVWTWPKPIGDIELKDGRDKPLDLPLTEVLTADNVPVDIDVALQIRITDIDKNLGAEKPEESLKNAAESDVRSIVLRLQSNSVAQEKQVIADAILKGEGAPQTPLEGLLLQGLAESETLWGIKVSQVRITHIRLPKILEDARTEVQVRVARQAQESQEAIGEMTEANHVAAMIEVYKSTGLSPTEAANIAQAERGKATRIILDGSAKPIAQAGALAGNLLNTKAPQQPPPANPEVKGQRRRGNS